MDNFVVSARKYRPITFDAVVGQESITSTLKNAIKNNHLAQAFLFTGPRGVGKTTCARIFAKTINCEHLGPNMEPCDECESCVSFNQNNSFNIHELDAASNNSVEDIRRLVEQVRIPPQVGRYKVYIIDEVHMLSQAAFNAFLKTLEEPPAYAKFILATTEKHKIIPTILSRCQIYVFNRITVKDIVKYLEYVAQNEGVEAEQEALHVIAQKADGAMRDALSIFDQIVSFSGNKITYKATIENLNVLDVDYYFKLVEMFLAGNISTALVTFDNIIANGFDGHHFINGLASHLRNLLVGKDAQTIDLLETSEGIKKQYKEQSARCSLRFLIQAIDICTKADLDYKTSSNKRLLVELSLMKLCKLTNPFPKEQIEAPQAEQTQSAPVQSAPPASKAAAKPVSAPVSTAAAPEKQNPAPAPKVETPKAEAPKPEEKEAEKAPEVQKAASEEKAAVAKRTASKSRRRTVSITDSITAAPKKEEKIDLDSELTRQFDHVQKQVQRKDLDAAIAKFAESIKNDKRAYAALLRPENILLDDNNKITIKLSSKTLDDKELRFDLLKFLKEELDNNELSLLVEIVEVKRQKTEGPQDIYKKMVKENPKLDEMRQQLDLKF
jgi:DNA polymerase-3 subunit gamma/tau